MATTPLPNTYGKDIPYAVTQALQRLQATVGGLTEAVQAARAAQTEQTANLTALRRELGALTTKVNTLQRQVADLQAAP